MPSVRVSQLSAGLPHALHRLFAWLRLMATLAMVACSLVTSTLTGMLGCGDRNPATQSRPQFARWWVERHLEKVDEAKRRRGQVDLLFVGDSITQNYERAGPPLAFHAIWDELFAPHRAMNLGFNGDRTSQLLWRLRHGEADGLQPTDVVLLIGANNLNPTRFGKPQTATQLAAGIMACIAEIHARMPSARILVLSILPSNISAQRSAIDNAANAAVQQQVASLLYVRYLDLTGPLLDGARVRSELYYDSQIWPGAASVHPGVAAQRTMAESIAHALYPH